MTSLSNAHNRTAHCFVYFTEIQCHFSQLCKNLNLNNETSLALRSTIVLYCEVQFNPRHSMEDFYAKKTFT